MLREGESACGRDERHFYVSFIPFRLKFISMQRVTVCKEPGTGETSGRQSSTLESERGNVRRVCVRAGERKRDRYSIFVL